VAWRLNIFITLNCCGKPHQVTTSDSVELVPYAFSSRCILRSQPFLFSIPEYADMISVYGFCDGDSVQAVAGYQQFFPNYIIPT